MNEIQITHINIIYHSCIVYYIGVSDESFTLKVVSLISILESNATLSFEINK